MPTLSGWAILYGEWAGYDRRHFANATRLKYMLAISVKCDIM
jgi:hypothetical protein